MVRYKESKKNENKKTSMAASGRNHFNGRW